MKKHFVLVCLITILSYGYSTAYDIEQDGIGYTIHNMSKRTLNLDYCPINKSGEFVIPSSIEFNGTTFTVDYIGMTAFNNCASITKLVIPNTIETIGGDPFKGCYGLKELFIEEGEESISCNGSSLTKSLFYDSPLENVYLGRRLRLTKTSLPSYVNGFNGVKTLKNLIIGQYVKLLDPNAFGGCESLSKVVIEDGEGILNIRYQESTSTSSKTGKGGFYGCPIEYLYVGRSITSDTGIQAGYGAFALIPQLKTVEIGAYVTAFDSEFYGSANITTVTALPLVPPSANSNFMDNQVYLKANLKVPAESLVLYQNTTPWSNFLMVSADDTKVNNVEEKDYVIYVEDGKLKATGFIGNSIQVYSLNGMKIYEGVIDNSPVLTSGIYLIMVENHTFKIHVRGEL